MDYRLLADEILVKLLNVDDEIAFKEIYIRHWKSIFNAAYYRIGSKDIAKELTQALFLRIWEKRNSSTIGNVESYLQTAIKIKLLIILKEL